jgi:PAS domain S-box-containing protein
VPGCIALLREAHDHDGYPPFGWPEDPVDFLTPAAETHAWVAVLDGRPVGHAALHSGAEDPAAHVVAGRRPGMRSSDVAVIARLVVARAARRTGLGELLLVTACDAARAARLVPALDVAKDLVESVRFYEALGWSRGGDVALDSPTGPGAARGYTAPPPRLARTAVVVAGPDGTIASASTATACLFGYAPDELIGQSIDVLVPHRFKRRHTAGWRRAWAAANVTATRTSLIPVLCADGVTRDFAGQLAPMTDPHGQIIAVAASWSAPSANDAGLPRLS